MAPAIIPQDVGNRHLCAKLIRMCGYSEDVAVMKYIKHAVVWQSGMQISLPHLISHVCDMIEERKLMERVAVAA